MPNLKEHVKSTLGFEKEVSCIPIGFSNKDIISLCMLNFLQFSNQ